MPVFHVRVMHLHLIYVCDTHIYYSFRSCSEANVPNTAITTTTTIAMMMLLMMVILMVMMVMMVMAMMVMVTFLRGDP